MNQTRLTTLKLKLFADGANLDEMKRMSESGHISGLTTNPTLMRKAGINDYLDFAKRALAIVQEKPISFEVFSDDIHEMTEQGIKLSELGQNVNVKIPITNSLGISTSTAVRDLSRNGVKVNVTAVMLPAQVEAILGSFSPETSGFISIFAGRIADTGRDPLPLVSAALQLMSEYPHLSLIWASPRELLNVFQAEAVGCHIITATSDILNKLNLVDYDLESYSLDTVKMFLNDARKSGYKI